jgi:hypothetical protein
VNAEIQGEVAAGSDCCFALQRAVKSKSISFSRHWLYSPGGPRSPLFGFLTNFRRKIRHFRRVISSSQGLYLHRTTQHRKTWQISVPKVVFKGAIQWTGL